MRRKNIVKQRLFWKKASFTVEASVIFPIILFLTAIVMNLAIENYQFVETYAQNVRQMKEFDPVSVLKTKAWLTQKAKIVDKEDVP